MPIARKPGETVDAAGVYKVIHSQPHSAQLAAMTLRAGEDFPTCKVCKSEVSYLLVISAPPTPEPGGTKVR